MTTEPGFSAGGSHAAATTDAPGTAVTGFVHAQINVSDLDRSSGTVLEYAQVDV